MTVREETQRLEEQMLAPWAARSAQTKGRARPEEECQMRTPYQRDRDRVIHCKSFRRLKHKTQVFLSPEGDHYRTRLTHTPGGGPNRQDHRQGFAAQRGFDRGSGPGPRPGGTPPSATPGSGR